MRRVSLVDCDRVGDRAGAGQQGAVLPDGRQRSLLNRDQEDGSVDGELQESNR